MITQKQLAEIHHSGKSYIIYKSKKGFDLFTNFSKKIILNNKNVTSFLNKKYKNKHRKFLEYLTSKNLENRPIISGNFVRQPVFKLLNIEGIHNPEFFEGGEYIHHLGFFIGLPCYKLSNKNIKKIVNIILEFDF